MMNRPGATTYRLCFGQLLNSRPQPLTGNQAAYVKTFRSAPPGYGSQRPEHKRFVFNLCESALSADK
jgi:hypothetical protein